MLPGTGRNPQFLLPVGKEAPWAVLLPPMGIWLGLPRFPKLRMKKRSQREPEPLHFLVAPVNNFTFLTTLTKADRLAINLVDTAAAISHWYFTCILSSTNPLPFSDKTTAVLLLWLMPPALIASTDPKRASFPRVSLSLIGAVRQV